MNIFPENSRVIFTGDSITAAANYTARIVDHYKRNLPERNVRFYQAAIPGSTLTRTIEYFDEMILPFKPTHATVFLAINDCGRGYLNFEDKEKKNSVLIEKYHNFKKNLNVYLDMLTDSGITPILFTPAPYAEYLPFDTECLKDGHRLSFEYAEVIRAEARRRGLELVDLHARLSELYMCEDIYNTDRVHPNDRGHYRMAECILNSQGLEIGEYRSLEDICGDSEALSCWQENAEKIGTLYAMYVCIKPELHAMPTEKQLEAVGEYVASEAYGDSAVAKLFSTSFMELKPMEKALFDSLRKYNGDI